MGVDDRHSKPTSAIEADELARLREARGDEPSEPKSADRTVAATLPREAHRPTSKIAKDELVGLLNMADVLVAQRSTPGPASPAPAKDDPSTSPPLEADPKRERHTQRMRAKHFQMLVRDGETDTLPLSPDGIDEGVSEKDLDLETRARRVAGLPRAQTLEYPTEMLVQLTAESTEGRAEAVPLVKATPSPPPNLEPDKPEGPRIVRTVPRAKRATGDVGTVAPVAPNPHDRPTLEIVDPPRPLASTVEVTTEMLEEVAAIKPPSALAALHADDKRPPRPLPTTVEVTPEMLEQVRPGPLPSTAEPAPQMLEEAILRAANAAANEAATKPRPAGSTVEVTPEMLEEVANVRRGPPTVELAPGQPASAAAEVPILLEKKPAEASVPEAVPAPKSDAITANFEMLDEREAAEQPRKATPPPLPTATSQLDAVLRKAGVLDSQPAEKREPVVEIAPVDPSASNAADPAIELPPKRPSGSDLAARSTPDPEPSQSSPSARPSFRRFELDEEPSPPSKSGSGAGMLVVVSLVIVAAVVLVAVLMLVE